MIVFGGKFPFFGDEAHLFPKSQSISYQQLNTFCSIHFLLEQVKFNIKNNWKLMQRAISKTRGEVENYQNNSEFEHSFKCKNFRNSWYHPDLGEKFFTFSNISPPFVSPWGHEGGKLRVNFRHVFMRKNVRNFRLPPRRRGKNGWHFGKGDGIPDSSCTREHWMLLLPFADETFCLEYNFAIHRHIMSTSVEELF